MKSKFFAGLAGVALLASTQQQWQIAAPGYRYEFPRDHFAHPDYRTEWWYYTGNLRAADGHRFGFELTFFRQAIDPRGEETSGSDGIWRADQMYLAHLALTDVDGGEFFNTERLNRAGPGLAGASLDGRQYWNGNWRVHWDSLTSGEQELQAVDDRFTLELNLKPEKPFVINGQNGISRKGPLAGEASHYISFTRLHSAGRLRWKNKEFSVSGPAWMDHEFFTEPPGNTLAGWDWFAIQLNTNEELMLCRLHEKSEDVDPYSFGTYVDSRGKTRFLGASEFVLSPAEEWKSAGSGGRYAVGWKISVASLDLELTETPALKNQELFHFDGLSPTYWEGAVMYAGHMHAQPVRGVGYLEMTGYATRLNLGGAAPTLTGSGPAPIR